MPIHCGDHIILQSELGAPGLRRRVRADAEGGSAKGKGWSFMVKEMEEGTEETLHPGPMASGLPQIGCWCYFS